MILNGILCYLNLGTGEIILIIVILLFIIYGLLSLFRRK